MLGQLTYSDRRLLVVAGLLTAATSLWVSLTAASINLDGIFYVSIAECLQKGDWDAATRLYNWCFYPWLLARFASFSGFSLEISAHILTACFAVLQTMFFVGCVFCLGGRGRVLLWAALLITFHSAFLQKRGEIIRDHGYWAFYLGALFFFLRFYRWNLWRDALAWGLMMVMALLFRVEGLLFLLLLPPLLLVAGPFGWRARWLRFGQANIVLILVAAGLLLLSDTGLLPSALVGRLGDGLELGGRFLSLAHGALAARAEILRNQVLTPYSGDFDWAVVLLIPWLILGYKIVVAAGYLVCAILLWVFVCRPRLVLDRSSLPVIFWLATLNFFLLLLFVYVEYFLQKRFVYPLLLLLLLLLPFWIEELLRQPLTTWRRRSGWLLLLIFFLQAGDGMLAWPPQAAYLRNAGQWLAQEMPAAASLYTNNPKIYYYSRHMQGYWGETRPERVKLNRRMLAERPWRGSDWVALWVGHGCEIPDQRIAAVLGGQPVKTFNDSRQDRIMVYVLKQ